MRASSQQLKTISVIMFDTSESPITLASAVESAIIDALPFASPQNRGEPVL